MSIMTVKELERFMDKVEPEPNTGCWLWTASAWDGYGVFSFRRSIVGSKTIAHRLAYQEWVGPIPDGFQIDHLCRVRCCVNPQHLEAVTERVNIQRSHGCQRDGKCKRGHDEWSKRAPSGSLHCFPCHRARQRRYYAERTRTK